MNKRERQHFRIHQPYCLQRQSDGRHIFLNREYKPLGLDTQERVRYEDFPRESLPGLTPRVAAALSDSGSDNVGEIYLYNDGCIPTESAANMQAYEKRLALLAKLNAPQNPESEA